MKLTVIDCETTGLDPAVDRVVQIAAVELVLVAETQKWLVGQGISSFVNPDRPIPPEASGIHHIVDADVIGAPSLDEALETVLAPLYMVDIVAAHNAKFDHGFLPQLKNRRWLCTWRCALHVWPEAPSFANCSLYYWLGFHKPKSINAHQALFDAKVTACVLTKLLAERTLDELLVLSTKCAQLRKVSFGKHYGKLWTEVDDGYLDWADKAQGLDPDVRFTVKKELQRRRQGMAA